MNIKPESEIISEEEITLYDYWEVLVKRKRIIIGIVLIPLVIVSIISLSVPRYYRGESEISNLLLPAPNIVKLIGDVDDSKKVKIFTKNSDAIRSVSIALSEKSTDKVNIIIDAKKADIIPQSLKDIIDYINDLPEIKEKIARIKEENDLKVKALKEENDLKVKNFKEENDLKIKNFKEENDLKIKRLKEDYFFKLPKLIEAKKANLIFLNQMTDMIEKRQLASISINPSDLIRKDAELSLEIMRIQETKEDMNKKSKNKWIDTKGSALIKKLDDLSLEIKRIQSVKVPVGILDPPSITKNPSDKQIKERIIMTGILSLLTGILAIFFIAYIDRMKSARINKRGCHDSNV